MNNIIEAIRKEIQWCKDNNIPKTKANKDFIRGLTQALNLAIIVKESSNPQ